MRKRSSPRVVGVLERGQALAVPARLVDRGDTGRGHQLADEGDAGVALLARAPAGDEALERAARE